MLTAAAEVGRLATSRQFGDPVAAAGAWLFRLAVHGQEGAILLVRFILRLRLDRLDPGAQYLSGRGIEAAELVRLEAGALAQRQQARFVEDLVSVGIADARHEGLV